MELRYTLICDGWTDNRLIPIIDWLVDQSGLTMYIEGQCAKIPRTAKGIFKSALADKIYYALTLYPCEILFIHRDSEKASPNQRRKEINAAITEVAKKIKIIPYVYIIPVRMTEAWLLIDIQAIRTASGNPNGRIPLTVPAIKRLEKEPDPKELLYTLLRQASGRGKRRLASFSPGKSASHVAEYITDFSLLRLLPAFLALENELNNTLVSNGWV